MVHGCRQLVFWNVRLSPATSATLIFSYLSKKTADVKSEEDMEDVKPSCPLYSGLHTCYNEYYKYVAIL